MPTYQYECSGCGAIYERRVPMSERTATIACGCGTAAEQVINWSGNCYTKGATFDFKLDHKCLPIGWEHGNTGQAQEARYSKMVNETRKRARQVDKQAIKGGIRHIATVPRELHRMRTNQFGKEYFDPSEQSAGELKAKLKADGQLFVD